MGSMIFRIHHLLQEGFFDGILHMHKLFFGDHLAYSLLFFGALFLLIIYRRRWIKGWKLFGFYTLSVLCLVAYNPFTYHILQKFLPQSGDDTLARLGILLPAWLLLAFVLTELISEQKRGMIRIVLTLLVLFVLVGTGESVWTLGFVERPSNPYKIKKDTLEIVQMIDETENRENTEKNTEKNTDKRIDKSTDKSTDESIDQRTDTSAEKSTDGSIDQRTEKSTDKNANERVDQSADTNWDKQTVGEGEGKDFPGLLVLEKEAGFDGKFLRGGDLYNGLLQYTSRFKLLQIRYSDTEWNSYHFKWRTDGESIEDAGWISGVLEHFQAGKEYRYVACPKDERVTDPIAASGLKKIGETTDFLLFDARPYAREHNPAHKRYWSIRQWASASNNQAMIYTIKDNEGHLLIIDGGWEEDAGQLLQVIAKNNNHVDAWILTHPHFDHIRAFNFIYEYHPEVTIDRIYASDFQREQYEKEAKEWDQIEDFYKFQELTKNADNLSFLRAGDQLDILGLSCEVFHDYGSKIGGDAANDGSLVFRLAGRERSMLFCGDTGKSQSELILNKYQDRLPSTYIQIGHHGNGGLTPEFYQKVHPEIAFFDAPEWLMHPEEGTSYTTEENAALMKGMGARIYSYATAPNEVILY